MKTKDQPGLPQDAVPLIISKLWWAKDSHSEQQLHDVKNLAGTGFDSDYIERWTKELGLHNLWQECKP